MPSHELTYNQLCETLYAELSPEGILEQTLTNEIASATWRLQRCTAAEANLAFDDSTEKLRLSIDRTRASAQRILHLCINQLRRLQTERVARAALNAVGDDAGLADFKQVVVASNNYERAKHLYAKSNKIMLDSQLGSFCNSAGAPSS